VGKYFMDGSGCSLGGLGASLVGAGDSEECPFRNFDFVLPDANGIQVLRQREEWIRFSYSN
jgi:hypothetical protein